MASRVMRRRECGLCREEALEARGDPDDLSDRRCSYERLRCPSGSGRVISCCAVSSIPMSRSILSLILRLISTPSWLGCADVAAVAREHGVMTRACFDIISYPIARMSSARPRCEQEGREVRSRRPSDARCRSRLRAALPQAAAAFFRQRFWPAARRADDFDLFSRSAVLVSFPASVGRFAFEARPMTVHVGDIDVAPPRRAGLHSRAPNGRRNSRVKPSARDAAFVFRAFQFRKMYLPSPKFSAGRGARSSAPCRSRAEALAHRENCDLVERTRARSDHPCSRCTADLPGRAVRRRSHDAQAES